MRRWFLSYNSIDLPVVERLDGILRLQVPDTEIFFAPKALRAGGYWLPKLEAETISCGPINTLKDTFADPQVQARGMEIKMHHPGAGREVSLVGSPIKMSETKVEYRHAPPKLGQHTNDVLRDVLGMDDATVADLKERGII